MNKIKYRDNVVTESDEIAHDFNTYFQGVFLKNNVEVVPNTPVDIEDVPVISVEGVLSLLRKVIIRKSSGPDGLPNADLTRYAIQIAEFL